MTFDDLQVNLYSVDTYKENSLFHKQVDVINNFFKNIYDNNYYFFTVWKPVKLMRYIRLDHVEESIVEDEENNITVVNILSDPKKNGRTHLIPVDSLIINFYFKKNNKLSNEHMLELISLLSNSVVEFLNNHGVDTTSEHFRIDSEVVRYSKDGINDFKQLFGSETICSKSYLCCKSYIYISFSEDDIKKFEEEDDDDKMPLKDLIPDINSEEFIEFMFNKINTFIENKKEGN